MGRHMLFCAIVMASKVWDDLSMMNADFAHVEPSVSLQEMNELELVYLHAMDYAVRVSAASYAKYYFHSRSMDATLGVVRVGDEWAPLNLYTSRKLQVLSDEYQARVKSFVPVLRRRRVTMCTTTDGAEGVAHSG
ncbi:hypothetical protein PsorP6_008225 [Peronosclerospora sorghi]|uniref:Uncharacterized protein n=1 Tax=Peronosclerospora sorghi TaxID=230839 RepID=A0ACC0WCR1_9STRA|nr:hypothetical protein PsorP6_008225 [Peronosclerospora sorghi]